MLFSTLEFLFLFLPACLITGVVANRFRSSTLAVCGLLLLNLVFYAWFKLGYVPLLFGSIVVNYFIGRRLISTPGNRVLLWIGVMLNLGLLGFFKYALFFSSVAGFEFDVLRHLVLPLAISFYTFQQISFIVDCSRGEIEEVEFFKYALYVSFFPQLIAGPIVRFSELYPQLDRQLCRPHASQFVAGLTLFVLGLGKKVLIADVLARPVNAVWTALGTDAGITSLDAWFAAFAYSFQIYFDFSAYSDMAIGLGMMMGVSLPVNFLSPYKALDVRDFWRRWHMTLSRWLRDYLYIPLGGSRNGRPRHLVAIFVTMALGGLWHGAGWNFIVWGCLHGLWIALSHLRGSKPVAHKSWLQRRGFQVVTFLGVTLLWVVFRGEQGAWWPMLQQLFSFPEAHLVAYERREVATLLLAAVVAFGLPANAQLFGLVGEEGVQRRQFQPRVVYAVICAAIFVLSVVFMIEGEPNAFIYFQF